MTPKNEMIFNTSLTVSVGVVGSQPVMYLFQSSSFIFFLCFTLAICMLAIKDFIRFSDTISSTIFTDIKVYVCTFN